MHLKILSAKYQPLCHSLNVLDFTEKPLDINHMNMGITYFITICVTSISPSNILMLPNNIMLGNIIILRSHAVYCSADTSTPSIPHFGGLVQEKRNSSALAMELRLSCTNQSIGYMAHKLSNLPVFKQFQSEFQKQLTFYGLVMPYDMAT